MTFRKGKFFYRMNWGGGGVTLYGWKNIYRTMGAGGRVGHLEDDLSRVQKKRVYSMALTQMAYLAVLKVHKN